MLAALAFTFSVSAVPLASMPTAVTALPPGAVTATISNPDCGQIRIDYRNTTSQFVRIDFVGDQANQPPSELAPYRTVLANGTTDTARTWVIGAPLSTHTYGVELDGTNVPLVAGTVTIPVCLNEAPRPQIGTAVRIEARTSRVFARFAWPIVALVRRGWM